MPAQSQYEAATTINGLFLTGYQGGRTVRVPMAVLEAAFDANDGDFAPAVHTHDDRYYTEGEVDALIAGVSGGSSFFVTVKDVVYGALGNGSNDDTAEIQAAIDAAYAAGGGKVWFPPGTYMVSGLVLKDYVTLEGFSKKSVTIKLISGSNEHVIRAGDFDTYANGVDRSTPVGCRSGAICGITIDGDKANQTVAHNGLAYYGIDSFLENVEFKNCEGWGAYVEAPGAAYSVVVGQNLQYSWRSVEAHDNLLGNIYYNGQSDSNLTDIVCYETGGEAAGQTNFWVGAKATGIRVQGLHCWGTSEYGVVNQATLAEFHQCHVESAKTYKVWAQAPILWHGGRIYEVGVNTSAVGFRLDADFSIITGVRASNINGGLVDFSAGGIAGTHCHIDIRGYTATAAVPLTVGTVPSSSEIYLQLVGLTTSSMHRRAIGFDMNSTGIDRVLYINGSSWSSVSVSSNTLTVANMLNVLNEGAPATVNDITWSPSTSGLPFVTFRNSSANAVTFVNNSAKLRNLGGTNVSVGQYQSITYVWISGTIWQQVSGAGSANATHTHAQSDITNLTTDLAAKAPLASPTFTGTPAAPTATAGTNTTQIATTAFVATAVANLIASAPGALDTLDELAAALGDDANFAATVTAALAGKVAKAGDTMTGKLTAFTSTTGAASFNIPPGTAPTSPVEGDVWSISNRLRFRGSAVTYDVLLAEGVQTVSGKKTFSAATTTGAFLNITPGTAPTSNQANGDIWTTTTQLQARLNGADVTFSQVGHTHAQSDVTNLTTDLAAKAPLASPTFTGTPAAPTATAGTNTTQIATTAFVATAVANLIASAPGALDTLDELAAALGDDSNFASTVTTALAGKQPLDSELTAIAGLTSAADRVPYFTGSGTASLATLTSAGRALIDDADAAAQRSTLNVHKSAIFFYMDGGGAGDITTGVKGQVGPLPFACTINSATILGAASGSIVVDIWKDAYANYPPTDADSITASAPVTLSSAQKSQDTTLTGWTTALAAGDILRFNVDSCSGITRATICLEVTRA